MHGKQGKPFLQQRIVGYNAAAQHAPWMVLVDLDNDHVCAPPLRACWLPRLAPRLCFRVAVHAVEAWLLADAERIATFLRVARGKVPTDPEIERVSQVKDHYDDYLLHLPGVVGHGVSLSQDGSGLPVIVLFLKDANVPVENFPTTVEGVPVETQVTGEFKTTINCRHSAAN